MSIQTKSSSLLPTKTRSAHRRKQSKRCAALLQSAQLYSRWRRLYLREALADRLGLGAKILSSATAQTK
jgi:hypothetical protein